MTLAMAAVFERVRLAIGDVSVFLFTIGGGTYIPGVANLTTSDGDARAIWVFLVRFDLVDNHGVANFVSSVLRYIHKRDEAEGACDFHALVLWDMAC